MENMIQIKREFNINLEEMKYCFERSGYKNFITGAANSKIRRMKINYREVPI
jgi:hypothetical protein